MAASLGSPPDVENIYLRVVETINNKFGEDVKLLGKSKQLHSDISERRDEIVAKMSIVSDEVPSKLCRALREVDEIMQRLEELKVLEEDLSSQVVLHLARVEPIVNDLNKPIQEITRIENYVRYLQWIQRVHDFSSDIQTALLVKASGRAVTCYCHLIDVYKALHTSKCQHLVNFIKITVQFWYKLLKDKFTREFEDLLKLVNWPVLPPSTIGSLQTPDSELYRQLEAVCKHLLHLPNPEEIFGNAQALKEHHPVLLPLQILLRPLKKRFLYHFYGHKETNNFEKPEWYFTQILTWIRDNSGFLHKIIQPIFDKDGMTHVNCQLEFMRSLVVLTVEKLASSIESILYDDYMLSHAIDETLLFEKELRSLGYISGYPTCMSVLTQDQCFTRWINMERKSAVEKMDTVMIASTAWKPRFQDHGDIDELRVPECGESFMTLILTITDRYKPLPKPGHRLQFLNLQLELLDDFRMRLQQLHKEEAREPLESNYCAILNTVYYVIHVLRDWSDLPFFLQMQYYVTQYELTQAQLQQQFVFSGAIDKTEGLAEPNLLEDTINALQTSLTGWSSAVQNEALDSLQEDFSEDKLDSMKGTVFDKIVGLLEHMKDEMIRKLADYVVTEVKAKSRPYRTEKWFSMPAQKDYICLSITATACPLLMVLKCQLHSVQELLAQPLFHQLWQVVAEELNYFLYKELILRNNFNEGGCAQIHFDLTRNFFPIFGEYTRRPENYFKEVKEAALLLSLPTGSALLLRDAMKVASPIRPQAEHALSELGVYKLTPQEAVDILNLRTDVAAI